MSASVVDEIPVRCRVDLGPGEVVAAFAWARMPRRHTPYLTDATTAAIINVFDLVRGWFDIRKIREMSHSRGFPLDRHMAMAVTDRRLMIWRVLPGRRRSFRLIGEVARDRIRGARLPYVGGPGGLSSSGWPAWRALAFSSTTATPRRSSGPCAPRTS